MEQKELKNKTEILKDQVEMVIKTVYDPEIPVNIWELGLIYDIKVTENNEVVVLMTLTAPNCPAAEGLPKEVEEKIKMLPDVKDAKVIITFDPPWDQSMMSDAAKFELGLF
jgi:FeS assembly SUF system protein